MKNHLFLLVASRQLPVDVLGSPDIEALVHFSRFSIEKIKNELVKLLPAVYETVTRKTAAETDEVRIGSFTYDWWSAKQGNTISGMNFNFIGTN